VSPPSALERLARALGELAGTEVELDRPSDPVHGEYATNVALRLAGAQKRPPREIAEELAARAAELPEVERAEVAGPGFVNLWLTREWYGQALGEMLGAGASFGAARPQVEQRIQVEMISANPTGPVTVASARNGAIGDSVARLLQFAGHDVEREYYYNDAGAQMEKFRASVDAIRRGEEPPEDGYRGEYMNALAQLDGDPVPPMLAQIEATLERFRVHFDTWALQSELEQRIAEFMPRLDTYEKDGAVWLRSSAYGDEDDRVIIRSPERGGTPTYRTADIVYLVDKLERGFDRAIYVLGADHHGTRKWYAAIARMLGYDPDRVEVLLYQLVHLTRGGEQTKISKRRGDVVFLDEFMDEVGVDAARWYLISRGPDQTIEIDVDLAKEKTSKNPVYYVQYVHARIAGIFRNAGEAPVGGSPLPELADDEKSLIRRLLELPGVAAEATERRGPHAIPTYAIRVADDFHRFYTEHRVLESDAQAFRLGLCRATQIVVARCLDLIGVEAPERM
jgi:arginyl-tRNA synthetase